MSKWYKASEIERLKNLTPRDGVTGLPDNHVITVSERVISVDNTELVQNNIATDTFTLVLDAEWDGITPVVIFTNDRGNYQVAYENAPTKIPAAAMAGIGSVEVSVFGLDSTGAVRVVTKAAPNTMNVVKSGKFVGEVSSDDASLLGQILAAAEAANEAAANANATVIKSAVATTLNPGEPATANLADHVLTIGVPKGEKGEKGDPGQNGTDGVTPFAHAAVTTLEPGIPATVAIEENTLKLGIPKGEKGDKGVAGGKGEKGDKGDPGTAATIAVGRVTGLDAGTSPTVVNSGTANAARFDFGIPKGDKGDTGDPGHTPQRGVDYWTAEDVKAVVEDAKAQAVAELAEIGNVPKRTVTDLMAHGEDAYAQKPIEVGVKGRTVNNLWLAINGTSNGITVSTNETGLITVTGTPTDTISISSSRVIPTIKPNVIYRYALTNVVSKDIADASFSVNYGGNGPNSHFGTTTSGTLVSTNFRDGSIVRCEFYMNGHSSFIGKTFSWSGRIMLVEGTEAPDCFTPPASITSVQTKNLVTTGKNLADITETDDVNFVLFAKKLPPGTYTFSCDKDAGSGFGFNIFAGTSSGSEKIVGDVKSPATFTIKYPTPIFINGWGLSSPHTIGEIQLELGSTATAYEPPNITTTLLPEVELRSLPNGVCDELVIGADGACRVERNLTEYEVLGTETISIGEHANGQKYIFIIVSSVNRSSMLSDRYLCVGSSTADKHAYIPNDHDLVINDSRFTDVDTAKSILAKEKPRFVFATNHTAEPQSPVTLPALPAPTFNQYHDADVPSDTSTTYTRDINIVIDNLAKQINTTRATISVDKASTIE